MSSLAYGRGATSASAPLQALVDACARRGSEVLLGLAIIALAAVQLASLPNSFDVDSWLALVTGRDLWQHGLPHHETLTLLTHGSAWIDQQWLAQVVMYGLYKSGGLALVGVVNVALLVSAIGGAAIAARRLGAHPVTVMVTRALCLFMIEPSREVRTQELALPLFVGLAYLLATDSRAPSRRVYLCLPLLVLWANIHGTVTLGVGLVVLHAVTVLWERRRTLAGSWRAWIRPVLLGLGAPLTLLVSPYGLDMAAYYRTMFLGSTVRGHVTEWQPITSSPATAIVFFVLAGVAIWSFGRQPSRTTRWERLALLVLAAGSIAVVRNVLFFGLFTLMLLPVSIGSLRDPLAPHRAEPRVSAPRRGLINLVLSLGAIGALLAAGIATALAPDSRFEPAYASRGALLSAVARATHADPSLSVLAEDRFADWLLWEQPNLSGRVENDSRFELLSSPQLDSLNKVFGVDGPRWKAGARGLRLVVLDHRVVADAVTAFRSEPGSRTLFDNGQQVVILRSARGAGSAR
jgi:hypothetical protein